MKVMTYDFEQYSEEWYKIRTGRPTASNFNKIVTSKGEPSKQSQKYMYQLAGEFIAGKPEATYQSAIMQRGLILEEDARRLYEIIEDTEVKQVGFCIFDGVGCSPDALVGDLGLLEIKAPLASTHIGYLLKGTLPSDYVQQVQGQMYVTGREWCDFMSYYEGVNSLIVRVNRDEDFIKKLGVELKNFTEELNQLINKLK